MSQFEPQAAGLGPNGNVGSMYGGMGGYGGQTPGMGAEKSNAKYGIGGLQFGGQPLNTGNNGAGKYGYAGNPFANAGKYGGLGAGMGDNPAQYGYGGLPNGGQYPGVGSNGETAGKYGYGRMPYEAQPAGISPEAKSAGTYGYGHGYNGGVQPDYASLGQGVHTANGQSGGPKQMPYNRAPIDPAGLDGMSQFEPQAAGLGPNGKLSSMYDAASQYQTEPLGQNGKSTGIYGGGEVPYAQQAPVLGGDATSYGKYGNHGQYQPQPYETASEDAGLPYEPLPLKPDPAVKSYVEGEGHTPEIAVEGESMSLDRYEHVGYINGEVQPEVVEFPGVPTSSPILADPSDPSDPSYLPVEVFTPAAGVEDLSDPAGSDDLLLHSAPAAETQGGAQPEDMQHQQEMPRQIHIQQHLKLHFHPKEAAKTRKFDLNGFFGNSGYQG
ncbi:hypothetical protein CesoFtcFv8_022026 [Champsocephalus esox]|uniref:Uncharacterized protein n=1 Tax=Champsocephalus esox TaxID=159716 RepID=A0AAN8GKW6_9TELE|nr:hypothetical protein CesoFtcFv8_022026 [Champsocephalus esox]